MKILARVEWLKSSSLVYINEKPQDMKGTAQQKHVRVASKEQIQSSKVGKKDIRNINTLPFLHQKKKLWSQSHIVVSSTPVPMDLYCIQDPPLPPAAHCHTLTQPPT